MSESVWEWRPAGESACVLGSLLEAVREQESAWCVSGNASGSTFVSPLRCLACLTACVGSSHRMVSCVLTSCCSQPILAVRQFWGVPSLMADGWIYKEDSSSSFCGHPRLTSLSQERPDHLSLIVGPHI